MPTYELGVTIVGSDRASGVFDRVRRSIERIGEIALGVVAARVLENVAQGLMEIARASVDAAAKFEMMQLSLTGLAAREMVQLSGATKTVADVFGDAEVAAGKLMDELSRIAILSPYQVDAVHYTYRMALAFGYTTKEALDFTSATLNMAAGIGADASMLQRMAYNLAQVRLQGKVTALDIRQLALAGFDLRGVLQYVSNQMGYTIKDHLDFNKLIAEGKISWEDFSRLYAQYAETMFAGASERMARSLYGLKSTFNDVFLLTMPQVVGPAMSEVVKVLNQVLNLFLLLRDSGVLEEVAKRLHESVANFMRPAAEALEYIEKYVGGVQSVEDLVNLVRESIYATFGPGVVARLVDFVLVVVGILDRVRRAITELFRGNELGVIDALGLRGPAATMVLKTLTAISEVVRRFKNALGSIIDLDFYTFVEALELPPSVERSLWNVVAGLQNLGQFAVTYGPQLLAVLGNFGVRLFDIIAPRVANEMGSLTERFKAFTEQILEDGPQIVESFDRFLQKVIEDWLPRAGEFLERISTEWIPALMRVGSILLSNIVPILAVLLTAFVAVKSLGVIPLIRDITLLLSNLATLVPTASTIGPILPKLGAAMGAAFSSVLPILAALAVLVGIVITLGVAWRNNWGGIQEKVAAVAGAVSDTLRPALEQLRAAWEALQPALQQLWNALQPIVSFLGSVAVTVLGTVLALVIGLITGLVNGAAQLLATALPYFTSFVASLATLFQGVVDLISGIWGMLVGLFTGNTEQILSSFRQVRDGVFQIVQGLVTGVINALLTLFGAAIGLVAGFVEGVIAFFTNLYNRLIGHSIIPDIVNGILQEFNNLVASVWTIGRDIVDGLLSGIKNSWGRLTAWLEDKVRGLLHIFDKVLERKSPSKALEVRGRDMMLGLNQGITRYAREPIATMRAVALAAQASSGTTVNMNNQFTIQDQLTAELVARRVKQLLLEATEK